MLDAVAALEVGAEALEASGEVGLREAAGPPGGQVVPDGVEVGRLVREMVPEARDRRGDRVDLRGRRRRIGVLAQRAVGRLQEPSASASSRRVVQWGSWRAGDSGCSTAVANAGPAAQ